MTNIQRAFCVVLSLIFLCVVAVLPGDFFRHGEIYRQLPLYCFLEKKALQKENGRDRETEMLLQEKNAEHLGKEVEAENRKEQETLLMAEAEEVEKKEKLQKKEELQKKKEIQKKEAEEAEKKSSDGKKSEKETGKENAEPEVTESGDTGQKVAEQETPASEENRSGENTAKEQEAVALPHPQIDLSQAKLADFDYVMNQFFILDSNTETNAQQISAPRFLKEDLSVKKDSSVPQILIYHTHSQEAFADSREGQTEDTIVGVGDHLTELLEKTYGYQVIHITDAFDMMGGTLDRSKAYDYARASIEKVLEENPTIEVVIDLHRDGVPDDRHLVTQVNGKPTAQLLFYNGLSYTVSQGAVSYLPNPYIEENLAFSFQLEYQAAQYYPDLYRGIYLAGLRYNLHLKPRALLLEAGAQTNTVEEVRNAMEPFADILNRVLKGSDKED
ncbi:stage II sporulation protein P [Blautia sp. LMAG:36]|uniref:stage II sporulation protein P n=1 Tax=Blautia sp. LMAG:36 TaxID=1969168 RepID=UPI00257C223B|nr:stage II sporulation protein P [Blautia sp. LMAG:36]